MNTKRMLKKLYGFEKNESPFIHHLDGKGNFQAKYCTDDYVDFLERKIYKLQETIFDKKSSHEECEIKKLKGKCDESCDIFQEGLCMFMEIDTCQTCNGDGTILDNFKKECSCPDCCGSGMFARFKKKGD